EGLKRTPEDELSWVARGMARLAREPEGALADFEEALRLNPRSREALQNKAHVLAEVLGKTAEAVAVLDQSVRYYPDHVPARGGRGVLLARLGRRGPALEDAAAMLRQDDHAATLYQVACVYALTSRQQPEDRRQANRYLGEALKLGYGADLL